MEDKKIEQYSEILKFIKFLAFKSTQVIVQSRLGGLIYTKCNQSSTDWVSEEEFQSLKIHRRSSNKNGNNKESIDGNPLIT